MNKRLTILSLLTMLVIAGLIAGFFTGSIQKALSAPMTQAMNGLMNRVSTAPTPGQATPGATTQPANGPTLALDNFQRPNQQFWGTATDKQIWSGDANKANAFSIANGIGQIANAQGTFNALLGQAGMNMEVMVSGSVNRFNNGKVNLGVVLRWTDNNDWYKVLIDGKNLTLLKRVGGKTTTLASQAFPAQSGLAYTLRFRAIGAMLFARAWPTGTPEPQNWMLNVTDNTLPTGLPGVRVLMQAQSVVNITAFKVLPATLGTTA